jgi:hypothetical protein
MTFTEKLLILVVLGNAQFLSLAFSEEGNELQPAPAPKVITLKKAAVKKRKVVESLLGKISGPVLLIRGKKSVNLSTEIFLKVNDQIWVKREGSARIWVNHSIIDLGRDTIVDFQGDRLHLIRGSLRVHVTHSKSFPIYSFSHIIRSTQDGEFHVHLYPNREQFVKKTAGPEISVQDYGKLTELSKSEESFSQVVCAMGSVNIETRKRVPLYRLFASERVDIIGNRADLWPKSVAKGEPLALENRFGWPEGN